MKDSIKHLTFIQVVLVLLVLVGCSSVGRKNVYTKKEPTVGDAVAEVIAAVEMSGEDNMAKEPTANDAAAEVIAVINVIIDDNLSKEPSSVLVGYSSSNSHFRSNSVWTSRKIVYPIPRKAEE